MSKTSIDVEVCSNCGPLQRLGSWLCNCRGGNHEAVPFVPASELAAAQEEGRVTRRALEMAVHDGFTGEDRTVQEFLAQARAEAKPTDGGGE